MMKTKSMYVAIMALLCALGAGTAWSQATAGKVQGKITNAGKPVPDIQVVLTSTTTGKNYKFKTDKNGQFFGVGIAFGEYDQDVFGPNGEKVFSRKVAVTGGTTQNGDVDELSVDIGQGGPKISKEEMDRLKAERDKALGENALIAQLNPALQAKNWEAAEPILQKLVVANPARWEYQQALGNTQLNLNKYEESIATFEKAIPLAEAATKNDPKAADPVKTKAAISQMLTNEGSAYIKMKQTDKAIVAYTKAAELDPNPGTAFFNLCATQYNSGNTDGALAACDKAIAADPNKADAYFIKGSLLIASSTADKDGKVKPAPGTEAALKKYLELAPDGPHAPDVQQMLTYIGSKIETTYKQKKK